MEIKRQRPFARGVDTLMYVGDDAATEAATSPMPSTTTLGIGLLALIIAAKGKGVTLDRVAAAGIAAVIGYRVYEAKKS